jgi:signal transduction histidine kinase
MPKGGVLEAQLRVDGARVVLDLTDSGVGVPAEVRAHLFEPYFTTRSTGTGLGLAIAKRVVEDHGGTIELAAGENGVGTRVRVSLPAAGGAA